MGLVVPVQKITLKEARCNLGLSLETVAGKLDIAVETLEDYERYSGEIPCDDAIKLFRLYKIASVNVCMGKK